MTCDCVKEISKRNGNRGKPRRRSVLRPGVAASQPRRDCSEHADALKVCLTAPPVDDRANEALVRLLAERLNVPRAAVRIVDGDKSRRKRVVVAGVKREQVLALLAAAKHPAKNAKD
jgi:uncharacterized protein